MFDSNLVQNDFSYQTRGSKLKNVLHTVKDGSCPGMKYTIDVLVIY
jgi:hypothetical protein